MTPELENKLYQKYPLLFANRNLPATQTCMCRGFEHGDGWYNIIDTLCQAIQNHIDTHSDKDLDNFVPQVVVDQVKEKFGTIRFYYSGGDNVIKNLVNMVELLSAVTCEICGAPGITASTSGWLSTLCDKHRTACNKI